MITDEGVWPGAESAEERQAGTVEVAMTFEGHLRIAIDLAESPLQVSLDTVAQNAESDAYRQIADALGIDEAAGEGVKILSAGVLTHATAREVPA